LGFNCQDETPSGALSIQWFNELRGFGQDEITERLLDERSDWTHHKGERRQNAYIERTIKRAVEIINE
jgi:hypothetical protein